MCEGWDFSSYLCLFPGFTLPSSACKCKGLPRGDLGKMQDSGTVNRKGERTYGRKLHKRGYFA